MVKKCDTFSHFDIIPACDGQADILRQHSPHYAQHRAITITLYAA